MIKFASLLHMTLIIFIIALVYAVWKYLLITLSFCRTIFQLPAYCWERAKLLEQQFVEETD